MQTTDQRTRVLSATTLMNEPVRNAQDENIGKIEDYMLDLESGCVQYGVLSFGGFLGIGEKLFAVPWQDMTLDTERHHFILDVDKQALDEAPGFDRNNWPMTDANHEYRDSVDDYWSRRRGMSGRAGISESDTYGGSSGSAYGSGSSGGAYGTGGTNL